MESDESDEPECAQWPGKEVPSTREEDKLEGFENYLLWRERMKNCFIMYSVEDVVYSVYEISEAIDSASQRGEELLRARTWGRKNAWTRALIERSLKDNWWVRNEALHSGGSARDLWLDLERYKPKGFLHARRFLEEFENMTYSPQRYGRVSDFKQALFVPIHCLNLMEEEEFRIPKWMWERRFVDCIQAVYGPILEQYLSSLSMREDRYDPEKRIDDMCGIVYGHEYYEKQKMKAYTEDTVSNRAHSRQKKQQKRRVNLFG